MRRLVSVEEFTTEDPSSCRAEVDSRDGGTLEIHHADRVYLSDYYREDVGRLSTLLGRDLRAWVG
jgi:hypothetical protein